MRPDAEAKSAWLVTWEGTSGVPEDPIAAILNYRMSARVAGVSSGRGVFVSSDMPTSTPNIGTNAGLWRHHGHAGRIGNGIPAAAAETKVRKVDLRAVTLCSPGCSPKIKTGEISLAEIDLTI